MSLPRVTGHLIGSHARNNYPQGGGYQRGNLAELSARIMAERNGVTPHYRRGEAPHGSAGGITRHRRRKEPLCGDCRAAEDRRNAQRRAARQQVA